MKRAVIYWDSTYDEGTGDELEARRNGRDPHKEHPIGPGIVLPAEWLEKKQRANETTEEKSLRLSLASLKELAEELSKTEDIDVLNIIIDKSHKKIEELVLKEESVRVERNKSNRLEKENRLTSTKIEVVKPLSKIYYVFGLLNWLATLYGFWYLINIGH